MAKIRSSDIISFHASNRGMYVFGPIIVAMAKIARVPIVLRIFGGSFGDFYEQRNSVGKVVIRRLVLSADIIFLQTKRSIRHLKRHSRGRLEWLSTYIRTDNSRAPTNESSGRASCTRFIFLGHLWRRKGLETILEAVSSLPDEICIDIFGPLDEYTEVELRRRGLGRARYCGFLTHDEVDQKLWDYDCLLLPTFHPSEGYPGVIAEAFAHGVPVISTNWLAIPEIVDDSCGILIDPKDTAALVKAMLTLYGDYFLWQKLCEGAQKRAVQFDHSIWSEKFVTVCKQLV
jgi:glycosyltransferase involved in cell wall biosynthesis